MAEIIRLAEPAPGLSRREAVLGGVLACTALASGALEWRKTVAKPVQIAIGDGLPPRLGERTATQGEGIVRPAETAEKKSIYDQEVSRIYHADGLAPIMLMIAYGSTQSESLQLHRPEFCYPAAGFRLTEIQSSPQPVGSDRVVPASFFSAIRPDREEHVLYWTRLGDQFPDSWVGQHIARMGNSIRGVVPDGVLVRASLISPNANTAHATLRDFLLALVTGASPLVRKVLTG